jgi:tetratricopeptide (TPR) repeat protein
MRLAFCFLLVLQIGTTSETLKDWAEWVSEGTALRSAGNDLAAVQAFRQALAAAKGGAPITDRQRVGILDGLASAYADLGLYVEADRTYRQALAILEKNGSVGSLDYAIVAGGMAVLPTFSGGHAEIITLLRESIAANGKTGSVRDLIVVRNCLADILIADKRYQEAETLLLVSQTDLVGVDSSHSLLLANCLNSLAAVYFSEGQYAKSVDINLKSIRSLEATLGAKHPGLIVPYNNIGNSYVRMGRLNDALLSFERATALCVGSFGQDRVWCGGVFENYAVVLRKLGKKRAAKELETQGQEIERAADRRNGVGATISVNALRSGAR